MNFQMDCDDVMMALAKGPACYELDSAQEFSAHIGSCASCAELSEGLFEEAEDEHLGKEIGAYKIQSLIGTGGMGRVYLATHPEILSRVAIKVFSKDWKIHANLVSRFFAEARATNVIDHTNIVAILDVGRLDDGRPYMVMEYLKGQPLSALVGTEALSDSLVRQLMLDVLDALDAAHSHKIIHRDLKPDNIFVSPEGRATLLDFGIAKLLSGDEGEPQVTATATGLVLGTPQYMSPEQATGDSIDLRTDVYAMGIILYECFIGKRPFEGGSLYRLMDQHVNVSPTRPRQLRPDLPSDVEAIIMRALEKRADDRFQNIVEMREALSACEINPESGAFLVAGEMVAGEPAPSVSGPTISERPPQIALDKGDKGGTWPSLVSWRVGGIALALGLATIAAVALLWNPFSQSASPSSVIGQTSALDAGSGKGAVLANSRSVDASLMSMPRYPFADASVAKAPDAALIVPKVTRTKSSRSKIAPLSLYKKALAEAQRMEPDAILSRIHIRGLNRKGRVMLSENDSAVVFEFFSQSLYQRSISRIRSSRTVKRHRCIVQVAYASSQNPKTLIKSAMCDSVRAVAPPRCSMAKLFQGKSQRKIIASLRPDIPVPDYRMEASYKLQSPSSRLAVWSLYNISFSGRMDPCL